MNSFEKANWATKYWNHQIVPWIIRQKSGSRLLGLTKRVLLLQEIADFMQSMDRLQLLLNSTPEQLTEK